MIISLRNRGHVGDDWTRRSAATYNLAGLPELHDVDDLLDRARDEREHRDDLGPSRVTSHVDDRGEDGLVRECEFRVEERVGEGKVGCDGARPPPVEVEADEEALVGETEEEKGARVVVVQPENTRDVGRDGLVRGGAGDEGAARSAKGIAKININVPGSVSL